ncbi:MAG: hypothetical protein K2I06_13375 [Ruminococcus sp.]|nr:hypothetical protein [Ruminococcus sp.]
MKEISRNASLKKFIEHFIEKDNIARLKFDGKLPENTYVKKINPDFSETEKILGFEIHHELKELLSLDFFIEGYLKNEYIHFQLCGGDTDIIKLFDKSDYFNNGHFCTIGYAVECYIEFDNDTGEVYFLDCEEPEYFKIADSVRELLFKAESIWSEDLYEK